METQNYLPRHLPLDLHFTKRQSERVALLTPADVARIDNGLLSFASHQWRKVAFLVMSAMGQLSSDIPDVPDTLYIFRVYTLIEDGRLLSDGDMDYWNRIEVRLSRPEIE